MYHMSECRLPKLENYKLCVTTPSKYLTVVYIYIKDVKNK